MADPRDPAGAEQARPSFSLAAKLDHLFRHVHPEGGGEYSYREVSAGIERLTGVSVSHSYLMYLRKGERTNPTLQHLEGIAEFFRVPLAYFLEQDVAGEPTRALDILATLHDAEVTGMALRLAELTPTARAAVARMIEEVGQAEAETRDQGQQP